MKKYTYAIIEKNHRNEAIRVMAYGLPEKHDADVVLKAMRTVWKDRKFEVWALPA